MWNIKIYYTLVLSWNKFVNPILNYKVENLKDIDTDYTDSLGENLNPISAGVLENQVKFLPQFKKMGWFGFHKKILVTNFLDALR